MPEGGTIKLVADDGAGGTDDGFETVDTMVLVLVIFEIKLLYFCFELLLLFLVIYAFVYSLPSSLNLVSKLDNAAFSFSTSFVFSSSFFSSSSILSLESYLLLQMYI
jgi:hypothetical protein